MPWIKESLCTGCGVCADSCYAGAITMKDEKAVIEEIKCIKCGVCHDVCSFEAVRHDGERISEEVDNNIAWAEELLHHAYYIDDAEKQKGLIVRLENYFKKNKKIAEQTLERLSQMQNND